ncbi:MAG: tetratricopeptide repeat protein [Gracilimonas sp.]|uniref:tetratricopeptide repeat protein n=1 Tax=Gracilimonas sp. TaxID=1974203 RepID=UPI0019B39573|nr:tetratricopeptide repeat protein [Gracilimonas sp.]MBD3615388.1 tetratricopeptide repeat protein [Gracilimonas sp.]
MSFFKKLSIAVVLPILFTLLLISCSSEADKYADDVASVLENLEQERATTLAELETEVTPQNIEKLVELGLWSEAEQYITNAGADSDEVRLAEAKLLFKKHRYSSSESIVNTILEENPANREAKLLKAELNIQAWELDEADEVGAALLEENMNDAEAGLIRGKVALLKRDFEEALRWAENVQDWDPQFDGGYLLEAEGLFWDQDPAAAEPALKEALALNPYNPDARFSYGYAVWRRVDATQLDNMAAQWNLAFEVNPLHYLTHWHFGNGHTNLTYADYIHPSDDKVREELSRAEALIPQNKLDEAIQITHQVEAEYPESVLPEMMRGSIYYMYYDMDRSARLDSSQAAFENILDRKKNYGPAHNGLAAVIKQRQFEYLDGFEELEQTIADTQIPDEGAVFYNVFKDANYYPGERVKKMIAQQIGPSKAYLPMINKFNSDFAIPPLHIDLAIAMDRSYFRFGTTFDNRQWMDIRGVGSGATGIEYLERGAHWERNVLAHEYAHLYHGRILTDEESRKIRSLYYTAKENNTTLDYYASNNESEFFAQGYAGFLSEKKVHPLNHKSMNTREFIQKKDPDYYEFLKSLLQKQEKYLAGNEEVLADNWAQTYLTLANRAYGSNDLTKATAYLDTALTFSNDYIPALLEYAEVNAKKGDFEGAESMITRSHDLDANYAPVLVTRANVIHQKALNGLMTFDEAMEEQKTLFAEAKSIEEDLAEAANLNRLSRERYRNYGFLKEAIEVSESYVADAPMVSTYLRDRKEDAEAFTNNLRSVLGYSGEVSAFFKDLLDQNPQNFDYRLIYADVLTRQNRLDDALSVLEEGQRILASADNELPSYTLRIAHINFENGEVEKAEEAVNEISGGEAEMDEKFLLAELYAKLGRVSEGNDVLNDISEINLPIHKAEYEYVRGTLAEADNNNESAENHYNEALTLNVYHLPARAALIKLMNQQDKNDMAETLIEAAEDLPIPLGPDFTRLIN